MPSRANEFLQALVEARATQNAILVLIIISSIALGLETSPTVVAQFGNVLQILDLIVVVIFTIELVLKLVVYRWSFFKDGWNIFDLTIVGFSLATLGSGAGVLRALRVLRTLRLLSMVPRMRIVVQGLLSAVPSMGAVFLLIGLVFYVSAVMATKLFATDFPHLFGTLGTSLYSLFQIMTLEGWSDGIVRPIMDVHPHAWAFFIPFILVTSFIVLNLFIAIIVNAMHGVAQQSDAEDIVDLPREVAALRLEILHLRQILESGKSGNSIETPSGR